MSQPIPKHIIKNNTIKQKTYNTLLIDGNNLLEISYNGDKRVNQDGEHIGGIFQFFIKIKQVISKYDFRFIYVFWDGNKSGQLRYDIYPQYKANRGKVYDSKSEYYRKIDEYCRKIYQNNKKSEKDEEEFKKERDFLMLALEELFIRQVIDEETEGDDLISYYVLNKEENERIVIMSGDRDLTQLISDDVIIYSPIDKEFINIKNCDKFTGCRYDNVLVKKIICGDSSDNIKGIKGVGEERLIKYFPFINERKICVNDIVEYAKKINDERIRLKKKPLKWVENIINKTTDGIQGENIYDINEKIIDLKNPLLTDDALNNMNEIMHAPLDPEGRSIENLYKMFLGKKIEEFLDSDKFSNFFMNFKILIDKEIKFFNKKS